MALQTLRLPLLRDHHTHPLLYAALQEGLDLGAASVATRDDALASIRAHAATAPPGWLLVHGWHSGRYTLTKADLDSLPPLVVFNVSLHGLLVNDAGRAWLRRSAPDVEAHLDDQEWTERNLQRVLHTFATEGASPERLTRFYRWLLETHGIYHAEEMLLTGEQEVHLFEAAGLLGRTRFWAAPDLYDALPPGIQARVHGIKLFADGALGTRTAALHESYRGSGHGAGATGLLTYSDRDLAGLLAEHLGAGRPVAVHAIGDRAVDQVVAAVEAAGPPDGAEVRIEHAQFISRDTARRAHSLGVRLCMQPNFSDDSAHYADRLPEGYPARNNPFRMLIDEVGYVPGDSLLFGSDGMPHGVGEALRQSLFPPFAAQALTVEEFVAGYGHPDGGPGHIEVSVDHERRQVAHRVVLDASAVHA